MADRWRSALAAAEQPLASQYDVALLDLDGVVYVGPDAVPNASEALGRARALGMRLEFVTNNASRPPRTVAAHLTELGIAAEPSEVVTSAQAAAHHLADRLPPGSRVLVVGTVGLQEALVERGMEPVETAEGDVAAVVQGFSPTLDWALLAEGSIAIGRGVPWVATNIDPTVPSPRGRLPGNGSMVAALRHATGAEPVVTGKPDPTMHRESVERSGAHRPLVVGDRLDTDIEGANAVGCDSLLVLTGVTSPADLLVASPTQRPTYLGADLRALLTPHPAVHVDGSSVACGGWTATVAGGGLALSAAGPVHDGEDSRLDALRALCVASWQQWDVESGRDGAGDVKSRPSVEAADAPASAMLVRLSLADGGGRPERS